MFDPQARGVGWLRAEDGIPRRVKAAYLTDAEIIHLAAWAAQARAIHHSAEHVDWLVNTRASSRCAARSLGFFLSASSASVCASRFVAKE